MYQFWVQYIRRHVSFNFYFGCNKILNQQIDKPVSTILLLFRNNPLNNIVNIIKARCVRASQFIRSGIKFKKI